MANQLPPEQRSHSFTKGLNVHGFGLNYAVIKKILDRAQHFGWQFVGSEIPLTLNSAETHADLVFYRQVSSLYLLGECKRVDPSRGAWCFGRSQHILGSGFATLDELHFPDMSGRLHLRPRTVSHKSDSYQVGVEVKDSQEKGDGCPSDQKPIAQAVTQVLRAANAFMQLCTENTAIVRQVSGDGPSRILSAVFTTARLYKTDNDLSIADLASGHLPESVTFSPTSWLWYQHALTKSLQAQIQGRLVAEEMRDWTSYFLRSAVRSVAIVNSEKTWEFLDSVDKLPLPSV